MARKRRSIHSSKRSSHKRFKMGSRGSSRKLRTGRTRLKPEVKFVSTLSVGFYFKNLLAISPTLPTASFILLNSFPGQGTLDTQRVGDTIMGKKLYMRIGVWATAAQCKFSNYLRLIIFNSRVDLPLADGITNFWQVPVGRSAVFGVVNREIINKVFFDKTIVLRSNMTGDYPKHKIQNVNISMNWPIIFAAGGVIPKDRRNNVYLATMGYTESEAEGFVLGYADITTNFYYTDS